MKFSSRQFFSARKALLIMLLVFTSGRVHQTFACSCFSSPSPCEAFGSADAVIIGTAIGGEEITIEGEPGLFLKGTVSFTVEQTFRGIKETEPEIRVIFGTCGRLFLKGEQYLLYLSGNKTEGFRAPFCGRSRHIKDARDDLEFLATLSAKGSVTRLYGAVGTFKANDTADDEILTSGVAGMIITASPANGQSFKTVTNEEGRYEFTSLQPGVEYTVKAELPDHYQKRRNSPNAVRINKGGCARVDFPVLYNGRISGQVLNFDETPATGLQVYLFRADNENNWVTSAAVDLEGNYQFEGIAPGVYFAELQIKIKSARPTLKRRHGTIQTTEPQAKNNPLSLWYPNAANRQAAEVIEMKLGQKLTGYNFKLMPQHSLRMIEGVALWANGSLASEAEISISPFDPQSGSYQETTYGRSDERGRFRISGFTGNTYLIDARLFHSEDQVWKYAEPVPIKLDDNNITGIKLVLKLDEKTYEAFKPQPPKP